MELNEKMIGEIAGQLGISSGKNMAETLCLICRQRATQSWRERY